MVHTIVEDSGPAERAETTRLIVEARQSKNHAIASHFILLRERLRFEREDNEKKDVEIERLTGERDRQYDYNAGSIKKMAAQEAEIERLQAELDDLAQKFLAKESVAELREEIGV